MAKVELPPLCPQSLFLKLLMHLGLAGYEQLTADTKPYEDEFARNEIYQGLTLEQLQSLPDDISLLTHKCVILPHFAKDNSYWLPFIWIRLDDAAVSIQLVIVGNARRFGFRWESPEGGAEGTGDHDYWHVQPIKSIRSQDGRERPLKLEPLHICDHFPTIPVDAENPVQMLDALLAALYGPTYATRIADATLRNDVVACSAKRDWTRVRRTPNSGESKRQNDGGSKKK